MCIIIYKPGGVKLPSDKRLQTCWDNNSDGAGFYVKKSNGSIFYKKGYMKFGDLLKAIHNIKNSTDVEIGIHFRIATSGGKGANMTHPFPISGDIDSMHALTGKGALIMHNGIIKCNLLKGLSDTASYVVCYLHPVSGAIGLDSPFLDSTIDNSRMLIAAPDMETRLLGFWEKDSDCWYSNKSYLPAVQVINAEGGWRQPLTTEQLYDITEWVYNPLVLDKPVSYFTTYYDEVYMKVEGDQFYYELSELERRNINYDDTPFYEDECPKCAMRIVKLKDIIYEGDRWEIDEAKLKKLFPLDTYNDDYLRQYRYLEG